MDIVYACDNKFVEIMLSSMVSLLDHNSQEHVRFYVLDDTIQSDKKDNIRNVISLYGAELQFLDITGYASKINQISGLRLNQSWPVVSFVRLYLAELIPDEIGKILYLDCDTIVNNNLQYLFDINMSEYAIAGVRDSMDVHYKEQISLAPDDLYINSGVILYNMDKVREMDLSNKFLGIINDCGKSFKYPDQDMINVLFRGSILELQLEYNVLSQQLYFAYDDYIAYRNANDYYSKEVFEQANANPVILHYTGGFAYARPWYRNCKHPYLSLFEQYYKRANGEMEYWGKDNRNRKQMVVSFLCRFRFFEKYVLRLIRRINNR